MKKIVLSAHQSEGVVEGCSEILHRLPKILGLQIVKELLVGTRLYEFNFFKCHLTYHGLSYEANTQSYVLGHHIILFINLLKAFKRKRECNLVALIFPHSVQHGISTLLKVLSFPSEYKCTVKPVNLLKTVADTGRYRHSSTNNLFSPSFFNSENKQGQSCNVLW